MHMSSQALRLYLPKIIILFFSVIFKCNIIYAWAICQAEENHDLITLLLAMKLMKTMILLAHLYHFFM